MSSTNPKTLNNDLTEGSVLRQLVTFSIPLLLANVLQAAYGIVDMIVVGHFVGAEGLSAVGISSQLLNMFMSVGMSFASGGQVLISQQIGTKDIKGLNRTVGTVFSTEFLLAVIMGLAGILFCTPLLRVLNTPPEAMQQAKSYLYIGCGGMVFIYGYNAVSSILRGMGESKLPFVFIAIATVVNIVLDLLFVGAFHWGAAGAAAATVIGQAVSFLCAIWYLYRHREQFNFDFRLKSFKIKKDRFMALMKLGIPMSVQFIAITVSMMYVNAQVNIYGVVASAVDGVGNKFGSLMNIISGALCTAGAAMIGQNFGAGRFDRIKQIFKYSMIISLLSWVVSSAVVLLFPKQIFSIFSTEPEVLEYAPQYFRIAVIFFLGIASMAPPMAVVEGIGNAKLGLIAGILDGVVARIALCTILGSVLGLPGFWLGNALAGFVCTIIEGAYYLSGKWEKRSVLLEVGAEP